MTPDQVQSIVSFIGQIFLYILSGGVGAVAAKVTSNTQQKNYQKMYEESIEKSYDLRKEVDALKVTVSEQKVQIDSQNTAALITATNLAHLSEDRQTLRLERDDYMRSWGKLESDLTTMKSGQQSDGERIKALERQVEELTSALKTANADLASLKASYEKLSGEKLKADQTIAVLEDKLKSEVKVEPT